MLKNKFTIDSTPFSFKFIPFYFLFILLGALFILSKIEIDLKVNNKGIIKVDNSNIKEEFIFSDYKGIVYDIFKNEDDYVKIDEPIFSIITSKNKDNEKKINYLENKIKNNFDDNLNDELIALQSISNIKIIKSNIDGKIETIFVQNGNNIKKNKKILQYKIKKETEKKFYVESFFNTSKLSNINLGKEVYITTKNKDIIIGRIESIYPNIKDKTKHFIKIELLNNKKKLKENETVNIKIIKKSEDFFTWFFRDII